MYKNIKIDEIKNMENFINGIEQFEMEKIFPNHKAHKEYIDDTDFVMGYNLAKRINSKDKGKKTKPVTM